MIRKHQEEAYWKRLKRNHPVFIKLNIPSAAELLKYAMDNKNVAVQPAKVSGLM